MRPLYIISSGFQAATPAYDDKGEVRINLRPVVAFTPLYNDDATNDFDFVQPITSEWDGVEHPDQLIKRPDAMFVDRYGRVGDEQAALRLFQNSDRHYHVQQIGKRYARSVVSG